MDYNGYLISHGGKIRSNNEDNGYLDGQYRKDDQCFFWKCKQEKKDSILTGVFDGVGGEDCGEIASRIAAETLDSIGKTGRMSTMFEKYVQIANRKILDAADDSGMASTFVLLSIENDVCHFCNMGDSRGYLLRNRKMFKMTKDHNMVSKMVARGVLTPEQARNHPDRHTIYQYLGMRTDEGMVIEPYIGGPVRVLKGDICLLCSDGLTDMVNEEKIATILASNYLLEDKARILLDTALNNGGRDNITILLTESK